MGTQITSGEALQGSATFGRDVDGTALLRGFGWPERWYRVPRAEEAKVAGRHKWLGVLGAAVPAAALVWLGVTGFVAGLAVSGAMAYAANWWLVRDLEEIPLGRMRKIAKPEARLGFVRKPALYWSSLGYMGVLTAASAWFMMEGELALGAGGVLVCGTVAALLVRERQRVPKESAE